MNKSCIHIAPFLLIKLLGCFIDAAKHSHAHRHSHTIRNGGDEEVEATIVEESGIRSIALKDSVKCFLPDYGWSWCRSVR